MTPAIKLLDKTKALYSVYEYEHDPKISSYGLEVSTKLEVPASQVFKTLVVDTGSGLAVAIIPVNSKLNLKLFAKELKLKKVVMAEPEKVERVTGYVLGGVSPLGQKKRLKTVLDKSAMNYDTIFVSAGRRGLEIELKVTELLKLLNATSAVLSVH